RAGDLQPHHLLVPGLPALSVERHYDTQRVEMFTDAILAVAITLMVLRIDPPQPEPGQTIGQAFASDTVPLIIYFLITFTVIVIFWRHHHDVFKRLPEKLTTPELAANMAFVACICLVPFGLEFFAAEDPSYLSVGVYAGLMSLATFSLGAISRLAFGNWNAVVIIGGLVFLLAIPFAPLLGGWCLMLWLLNRPINLAWQRIAARRATDTP
ncbi:MAG: TMEM175 family protein, partial [Miltoncostaeaceae bacterium]